MWLSNVTGVPSLSILSGFFSFSSSLFPFHSIALVIMNFVLMSIYRSIFAVSFADDCRHDNVTSLNAERGHVALYPRTWRGATDFASVERRVLCPWLIEADPGRRITVFWARSPFDIQLRVSVSGQQTTSTALANECHVIIEFIERGEVVERQEACRRHGDVTLQSTSSLYESKGSQVEVRVVYNFTGFYYPTEQRHASTGLLYILRYVG